MTWISLACLLVLSSSVLGGYGGGYGDASVGQGSKLLSVMLERPATRQIVQQGYGQVQEPQTVDWSSNLKQQELQLQSKMLSNEYGNVVPKTFLVKGYGQNYGGQQFDQSVPQVQILSPADELCRGQRPETVIPIEDHRKFVVCLDESKGVVQQCPKGLFYHPTSLRCERKLGPLENACASQPCANGGQCLSVGSSFQCQCAPGFDGQTCELDARVCQTQYPCGQSPDVKCQSFRLGAALQYICIFLDGSAYGLTTSQIIPSPCHDIDGPQALAVTKNGFIMCDGERMHVDSCPGGTVWDDLHKACVWADMDTTEHDQSSYGKSSYGRQQVKAIQSSYGVPMPVPQQEQYSYGAQQPKVFQTTYGAQNEKPKHIQSGYGSQMEFVHPQTRHHHHHHNRHFNGYGNKMIVPQQEQIRSTYGGQVEESRLLPSTYGGQIDKPKLAPSTYGGQVEESRFIQPTYGGRIDKPKLAPSTYGGQVEESKHIEATYGGQVEESRRIPSTYGGQVEGSRLIPSTYGGQVEGSRLIQPKYTGQVEKPKLIPSTYVTQPQVQPPQEELISVNKVAAY